MLRSLLRFLQFKKQETNLSIPKPLLRLLGFHPNNPDLFIQVFTPRSAQLRNKQNISINYERLEFLGDAMLGAVIAKFLYDKAPEEKEGYLTQMRSKIVSRKHLNEIGKDLRLLDYIAADIKAHYSLSQNIAGDIFEALVGAIYEDQGYEKTQDFIHRIVINQYVDITQLENKISSYKSYIFEWAQKNKVEITFSTAEENNAEDITIFVSIIKLDGKLAGKGRGSSKKKAEENAAKRVYYAKQNYL